MGENNSVTVSFLDPDVLAFEIVNKLDLDACEFAVPTSQLNCEALFISIPHLYLCYLLFHLNSR